MRVQVFIDGQRMEGFTDLRLQRSKQATTGTLSLSVFMSYMPDAPVMGQVTRGQKVYVYIGGHLAFNGIIDRRQDTGESAGEPGTTRSENGGGGSSGGGNSISIGPTEYTLRFECRGKTKTLIDCSHQHSQSTILQTSARQVFEDLVQPFGIALDWQAEDVDLNRVRLRDGGRVTDELERVAEMCGLYYHETRDGKLRVVDRQTQDQGEALILGTNILTFSTSQESDQERKKVKVKGQKNDNDAWGEQAVLETYKEEADESVIEDTPLTVQMYGNGTDDHLQRRIDYEVNKRAQESKKIEIEVFDVLQSDGSPWDIGNLHYVQIPPAGIFGTFEVTNLSYTVDADKTLKTSLTLAPTTTKSSGGQRNDLLGSLPSSLDDALTNGVSQGIQAGYGVLAQSWGAPALVSVNPQEIVTELANLLLDEVEIESDAPPLTINEENNR